MEKPRKEELLDCPFCGGIAEILDTDKIPQLKLGYPVGCSEEFCGARIGGLFKTPNEAIALWNTRAMSTWLEGEVPTVCEIIDILNKSPWIDTVTATNRAMEIHALITRKLTGSAK